MDGLRQCSAPGFLVRHEIIDLLLAVSNLSFDSTDLSEVGLEVNGIVNQRFFSYSPVV